METYRTPVTPEFGSTKNPIDLTGQATAAHYDRALEATQHSENIHSVISLYCETALFDVASFELMIEKSHTAFQEHKKPVLFAALGGEKIEHLTEELRRRGIPIFSDVTEAVSCLGALYEHYRYRRRPDEVIEPIEREHRSSSGPDATDRSVRFSWWA